MTEEKPAFTKYLDLVAERFGGQTLLCTDDFFAEKENLLKPGRGIFITDKYTDRGKWMDGWESRRKRMEGHDWCLVKMGAAGKIKGVDIDTNHFLGNHPPFASLEACYAQQDTALEEMKWKEILPKSPLQPGSQNFYAIQDDGIYNHVRLHIYPDGGVARLKVYGEVEKNWAEVTGDELIELAAATNGAKSVLCNDMFFSHMDNLLMPGRGMNMGDGWETKRNRTAGNRDWVIIRLAHKGIIKKAMIDTCHFKGNYPDRFMLDGCVMSADEVDLLKVDNLNWQPIMAEQKLSADCEHEYEAEILQHDPVTHVRLSIFPDGGVSRMRLWGIIV
ncbi:MAG: allantoicase [Ferruginibacter sp.]